MIGFRGTTIVVRYRDWPLSSTSPAARARYALFTEVRYLIRAMGKGWLHSIMLVWGISYSLLLYSSTSKLRLDITSHRHTFVCHLCRGKRPIGQTNAKVDTGSSNPAQ